MLHRALQEYHDMRVRLETDRKYVSVLGKDGRPYALGAWVQLVRQYLAEGRVAEARRLLDDMADQIAHGDVYVMGR